MSAVLLVCDMQAALDERVPAPRGADAKVAQLLAHWRERGLAVVHLRTDSMDPAAPDAPGRPGHDWLFATRPLDAEIAIEHRTANAFIGSDLMQVLEDTGAHELVICGATLSGTVESTLRMAHAMGFMVFLPADAVIAHEVADRAGRRWSAEEAAALTLGVLDGAFCQVVTVEALVAGGAGGGETVQ